MSSSTVPEGLINAAAELADRMDELQFSQPVTHVYNPLRYAWKAHCKYLRCAAKRQVQTLFLGMNPGPWGMAQTGVPFGEVDAVRDFIGIDEAVDKPVSEHPKRPIEGFACKRSEVSGRRLWGLFEARFHTSQTFFRDHFVLNYCPLIFMEASGKNRTPDKLTRVERDAIQYSCDEHLIEAVRVTKPKFMVGIGAYAEAAFLRILDAANVDATVSRILHPSPASPAANKNWARSVTVELETAGVWNRA